MTTASARLLVGRTIIGFEPRSWTDENGIHHNPRIVLDNGARITFVVTETNHGDDYGVTPCYHPAVKP